LVPLHRTDDTPQSIAACGHRAVPALVVVLLLLWAGVAARLSLRADDDVGNEYRLSLFPYYPIKGRLTGFSDLEYRVNPEEDYQAYQVLWPGLTFTVKPWIQFSGGLISRYTDHEQSADTFELRPFGGVKFSLPNPARWNIYNYTRYEFRDFQDRDTHDWTGTHRARSRFGVEFALTSREKAWTPKTWYGLADVEPFYRFDTEQVDPVRVRGGLGYVLNDHLRLELIYYAQFTRPAHGSLQFTENIFRLNIKIVLERRILQRLQNMGHDD
jgi:hypothetical protein